MLLILSYNEINKLPINDFIDEDVTSMDKLLLPKQICCTLMRSQ